MRRFEKIISLVAVLGVLLHAGLLVRHNGVMLDAAFDQVALSFAQGIICHSDGMQPGSGKPGHSGKLANCPVCLGATAAAAILPPLIVLPGAAAASSPQAASGNRGITGRLAAFLPRSRAPPSI